MFCVIIHLCGCHINNFQLTFSQLCLPSFRNNKDCLLKVNFVDGWFVVSHSASVQICPMHMVQWFFFLLWLQFNKKNTKTYPPKRAGVKISAGSNINVSKNVSGNSTKMENSNIYFHLIFHLTYSIFIIVCILGVWKKSNHSIFTYHFGVGTFETCLTHFFSSPDSRFMSPPKYHNFQLLVDFTIDII